MPITALGVVGPPGPPGNDGAPGLKGDTGDTGATGASITPKGTVATVGALPASGNTTGDLYTVTASGHGYGWNGSAWVDLGQWQGPPGPTGAGGATPYRFEPADNLAYANVFADGKRSFVEFGPDGAPTSWSASLIGTALDAARYRALPQQALRYPAHLDRWSALAQTGRYTPCSILCVGDSITLGRGSVESADVGGDPNYNYQMDLRGYVGICRSLWADRYGDIGEGIVTTNAGRVTLAGGAVGTTWDYSLSVQPIKVPTGGSCTVSLLTGTTIKVHCLYVGAATDGPFTYQVDGGSAVTATSTPTSGTNVTYVETITGLSNTTHTLVINGPAGGKNAMLCHVEVYKDLTKGYRVGRAGWSGAQLTTFVSTLGNASRPLRLQTCFADTSAKLVTLFFGTNEYIHTQATSPTDFGANMADLVTYLTDTLGKTVLLIGGNYPQIDAGVTETWTADQFWDALVSVAAANANCAMLDLRQLFGATKAAQQASGYLYSDLVHFSPAGHARLGAALYQALGGM